jgi:hypothetical protein
MLKRQKYRSKGGGNINSKDISAVDLRGYFSSEVEPSPKKVGRKTRYPARTVPCRF